MQASTCQALQLLALLLACLAGLASGHLSDVCKFHDGGSSADCARCCAKHQLEPTSAHSSACLCERKEREDPLVLEILAKQRARAHEAGRRCQRFVREASEGACSDCCQRQLMALDRAATEASGQCQCEHSLETQLKFARQAHLSCANQLAPTYTQCFECCQANFLDGDLVAFASLRDQRGPNGEQLESSRKNCRCRVDLSDLDEPTSDEDDDEDDE